MPGTTHEASGSRTAVAALSIGALVLASLIAVQGAGLLDRTARAEMSVKAGGYSVMTTDAQVRELLYVIDDRAETLMVYDYSAGPQGFALVAKENLSQLFGAARGAQRRRP